MGRHALGIVTACVLALTAIVASGCATVEERRLADPCCRNAERFPPGLVAAIDPLAPLIGRAVGLVRWRQCYLADQRDARAAIMSALRPLDIVLVSNRQRLSGHTIPGLFGHAAVYLGTDAQLRAAGLWSAVPAARRADLAAGAIFLEADQQGVHLSRPQYTLDTDRVLVLRPVIGERRKAEALAGFIGRLGMPFDFRFDTRTADCVFCTELVARVLPELRLREHRVYGRELIFPDEVARTALDGNARLRPRLYVVGTDSGWHVAPTAQARGDINREWRK